MRSRSWGKPAGRKAVEPDRQQTRSSLGTAGRLRCRLGRSVREAVPRLIVALLCWAVSAQPVRVIDGDTFVATAAVWVASAGEHTVTERVRVLGVNTPERSGATRAAGDAAKAFTEAWLAAAGSTVRLAVCQRDAFGRILADVTRTSDGHRLATDLIASGNGVLVP